MEWLKISTTSAMVRMRISDILCVVAEGNYSTIHLAHGRKRELTMQLGLLENILMNLPDGHFVRLGRSVIVNKDCIQSINLMDHSIVLAGSDNYEIRVNPPRDCLKVLKEEMEATDE